MFYLLLVLFSLFSIDSYAETSADEILRKADDIRNPLDSFHMIVDVTDSDASKPVSTFDVKTQGKERTLIKTIAPSRDKGRNLLMIDENMWLYIKNLDQTVRMSLNQKLTGQTANGDISRMKWHGDYNPQIESKSATEWTLLMTASRKGLTYEKIRLVVDEKTFRPMRAEYLSLSGETLKKPNFLVINKLPEPFVRLKLKFLMPNQQKIFRLLQ